MNAEKFRAMIPLGDEHSDLTAEELLEIAVADFAAAGASDIAVDEFGFVGDAFVIRGTAVRSEVTQ